MVQRLIQVPMNSTTIMKSYTANSSICFSSLKETRRCLFSIRRIRGSKQKLQSFSSKRHFTPIAFFNDDETAAAQEANYTLRKTCTSQETRSNARAGYLENIFLLLQWWELLYTCSYLGKSMVNAEHGSSVRERGEGEGTRERWITKFCESLGNVFN